jgi:AAA+ ATPase superfamily predicted ATPase
MIREVLSYRALLHGRATAILRLRPLPYAALMDIFSLRSPAERLAIYSICGGVPAYAELFTRYSSFVTALRDHCLESGSIMLTDPALILSEQLPEPHTYESALCAIAAGFHKWSEIARMAGIPESSLQHYLKNLQKLQLIERRDPVLARPIIRGLVRSYFLT